MKRIVSIIALFLGSCILLNGQEHLKVKNIPIEGSATSFIAKLKATGLKHYTGSGTDEVLKGQFAGMPDCYFIIAASDKTQTVFRVGIMTDNSVSWSSLKSKYNGIKDSYSSKYPDYKSYEYFTEPYYEGDGYELQALRLEKCTYATYFFTDEGSITVEMKGSSGEGYVVITYEDNIGFEKAKAERNATVIDDI